MAFLLGLFNKVKGLTLPNLDLILYTLVFSFGVWTGYYFTHNHYLAKEVNSTTAVLDEMVKQAAIDRKVVEDLSINVETLRDAYIKLGGKARVIKITTTDCTLTPAGVGLWNESLLGKEVLPSPTSGVTGTGGSGSVGVDFAEAFQNKLLNDQACNKLRAKQEALRKWDEETFGDR